MTDPYQVLGITRSASDDEIKKAYRALSRKYHPDSNINNPNKEQAEEKFKEVQTAYQQIMYEKQHPYASQDGPGQSSAGSYQQGSGYGNRGGYYGNQGSYGQGGGFYGGYGDFWGDFEDFFGGFTGGYGQRQNQQAQGQDEDSIRLQATANYLNSRHYQEALNVLRSINHHSALWYYYSAIANSGLGNNVIALQHAQQAAQMDPSNRQYQALVESLRSGPSWYQSQQNPYTTTSVSSGGWCLRLCLANLFLNLLCGGGGLCCGGPAGFY